MALQFFTDVLNTYIYSGVSTVLCNRNPGGNLSSVTIFSGTQPTAAQVVSSWSTYSAQYLVHWPSVTWPLPPDYQTIQATQTVTASLPAGVAAFRTGTAGWGICWGNLNASAATIQGATLPGTQFIVVPVTVSGGNGIIKMTTMSIVSGTSYQPADISFKVGLV